MRLSKEQSKFTLDVSKLIAYAFSVGIQLTFGETYRTVDQQYLYFKGKNIGNDGKLVEGTKRSWTMKSKHLDRLAVDFNFFLVQADGTRKLTYDYDDLLVLGEFWEGMDEKNEWGGFWLKSNKEPGRDTPHFQRNV